MRIIQSYWTEPMTKKSEDLYGRIKGGWPSMHHALCAMAYSCLTINRHYKDLHLYTDDFGASLLVDDLRLPYSEVHTTLNNFDVDLNLWALAKVHTYGMQEVPFIHIDNDIFIWDKLPEHIENASLCAQNNEAIEGDYSKALGIMDKTFCRPKKDMTIFYSGLDEVCAYNAGILGGSDIDFIREYANEAMQIYQDHKDEFKSTGKNIGLFNIVLEQLLFGIKVRDNGKSVDSLIKAKSFDDAINQVIGISEAPIASKFVHCLGAVKQSLHIADQIKYRLKFEFPEFYTLVTNYCQKHLNYKEPVTDIEYGRFIQAYQVLGSYNSLEDFMAKERFRLHPEAKIKKENDEWWLIRKSETQRLSGWGKILIRLNEEHSGAELAAWMNSIFGESIPKETIYNNVASYLMQALYYGNTIQNVNSLKREK